MHARSVGGVLRRFSRPDSGSSRQLSLPPNDGQPAALNREASCLPADLSALGKREEALLWHVCQAPPRHVLPTWSGPRLVCALSDFQNGVWAAHVRASVTFSQCGPYTTPSSLFLSQERNSLALIDGQRSHERDGWRNSRILQNRAGRFFPHTWETENNVEGRAERLNSILHNSIYISFKKALGSSDKLARVGSVMF